MAKKKKKENKVSFEDLMFTNTLTIQALINLLEKKNILTMDEVVDQLERMEDEDIQDLLEDDDEV